MWSNSTRVTKATLKLFFGKVSQYKELEIDTEKVTLQNYNCSCCGWSFASAKERNLITNLQNLWWTISSEIRKIDQTITAHILQRALSIYAFNGFVSLSGNSKRLHSSLSITFNTHFLRIIIYFFLVFNAIFTPNFQWYKDIILIQLLFSTTRNIIYLPFQLQDKHK